MSDKVLNELVSGLQIELLDSYEDVHSNSTIPVGNMCNGFIVKLEDGSHRLGVLDDAGNGVLFDFSKMVLQCSPKHRWLKRQDKIRMLESVCVSIRGHNVTIPKDRMYYVANNSIIEMGAELELGKDILSDKYEWVRNSELEKAEVR